MVGSLPQEVDAVQKVYTIDVRSIEPLFTGLICRPKDEMEIIHISQECLCSFCKNAESKIPYLLVLVGLSSAAFMAVNTPKYYTHW